MLIYLLLFHCNFAEIREVCAVSASCCEVQFNVGSTNIDRKCA